MEKGKKENGEKVVLTAEFGKVYVRVHGNQIMRPIKAEMALYEKSNHIYKSQSAQFKDGKEIRPAKWNITSDGYTHLNKVASISILSAPSVVVDGIEQPNPYVERNKRTRAIEAVMVRKIGIGYSPAGNVTAVDKTLFYNVYTYFIQSIQAKMKRTKWEGGKPTDKKLHPDCAITGMKDAPPEIDGKWAFYQTVPPLGIWINYADPIILDCLDEHTQRQRFGDRIAQKIVERNILKDHPAIGISQVEHKMVEGKDVAYVTVSGYRHDMIYPDISKILQLAARGNEDLESRTEEIKEVSAEEESQVIQETLEEEKAEKDSPATLKEPPEDASLYGGSGEKE